MCVMREKVWVAEHKAEAVRRLQRGKDRIAENAGKVIGEAVRRVLSDANKDSAHNNNVVRMGMGYYHV